MQKDRKILTNNDLKEMFHLSISTIQRRVKDGTLKPHKFNVASSKVFYYEDEVLQALKPVLTDKI